MLIKKSYFNKKTINTGNYENENPQCGFTIELDTCQGDGVGDITADFEAKFARMVCETDTFLEGKERQIRLNLKPLDHHRVTVIDGVKYPHVTTIITPITPLIPDIDKHAEVGTLLDSCCKSYVEDGVLTYPDKVELEGKWLIMFDECFHGMSKRLEDMKKHYQFQAHSVKVHNKDLIYCGELDAVGMFKKKTCIFDFKKTKNLDVMADKYFTQMAAYSGCLENPIDLLVIVSPYNDPLVTDKVGHYFDKFKELRKEYKEKYGI